METSQKMKKEMGGCCGGGCHSQEPLEKTETTCSPTAEELTDLLKRTQANFDNYRKQMQAHVEEMKKMAMIERVYRDEVHTVKVLEKGFEYRGWVFRSLTAIAGEITGSHWNGYHFFRLA